LADQRQMLKGHDAFEKKIRPICKRRGKKGNKFWRTRRWRKRRNPSGAKSKGEPGRAPGKPMRTKGEGLEKKAFAREGEEEKSQNQDSKKKSRDQGG